jgi:hypothetical protein
MSHTLSVQLCSDYRGASNILPEIDKPFLLVIRKYFPNKSLKFHVLNLLSKYNEVHNIQTVIIVTRTKYW